MRRSNPLYCWPPTLKVELFVAGLRMGEEGSLLAGTKGEIPKSREPQEYTRNIMGAQALGRYAVEARKLEHDHFVNPNQRKIQYQHK